MRSFSQGRDIPEEKKFVRTVSHGQHAMPDLAGSPETREKSGAKLVSVSSGEVKRDRHSHSGKCGREANRATARSILVAPLKDSDATFLDDHLITPAFS